MKLTVHIVEKIAAQNSASKSEVEAILEGFKLIDDSIILLTRLDVITPQFINVQYDLLEEIFKSTGIYYLLYNLGKNIRPDALSRRTLLARLIKSKDLIKYFAFGNCVDLKNINAMEYMMTTSEIVNYSIFDTEEEAINKLKEVRKIELSKNVD